MISGVAGISVFGVSILIVLGIVTFLLLLFTATIGLLNFKGIRIIQFKWHPRFAITTLISATIHAILVLSTIFRF